MKKNTLISEILQETNYTKDVSEAILSYNKSHQEKYYDTGRKLTVVVLIQYFLLAAMLDCRSFREVSSLGTLYGLPYVDYSGLSRKASEVPWEIIQTVCLRIFNRFPREIRRKDKKLPYQLLQILDSTRIIECKSKFPWAYYLKESSGLKFHVLYFPELDVPADIRASEIGKGDTSVMTEFDCSERILVADRGYMNVEKFCELDRKGQKFVIRLRNTVRPHIVRKIKSTKEGYTDDICTLGNDRSIPKECREHPFRIVSFVGADGKLVRLCTNELALSAEEVGEIYRVRWEIECFFRRLKQNFQIKHIFGHSANSAFSQGFIAFLAYLFLNCIYSKITAAFHYRKTLSSFLRSFHNNNLPPFRISFRKTLLPLFP